MEDFLRPYLIVFGTAAVLFAIWWAVRRVVSSAARGVADRTITEVRRHDPPATVAQGANAWSCSTCKSVNRPDATVCYRCRGERVEVEGMQGRI